jgi:hypothetical protein
VLDSVIESGGQNEVLAPAPVLPDFDLPTPE